jgi:hypothetical protein
MIMLHRKISVLLVISSSFLLGGCASIKAELQGMDYPPDTAILIGDIAYQISTIKCAQIKAIGEYGELDCYDLEGQQSASITPVSDWRRSLLKEKMDIEWASPEHQAYLFKYFHGGGKEKAARAIISSVQQVYGTYAAVKDLSDTIDKSREIDTQSAKMKIKGVEAYVSGGMPAWHAHQSNVTQWHLDNSRYFINQMNKSNPMAIE